MEIPSFVWPLLTAWLLWQVVRLWLGVRVLLGVRLRPARVAPAEGGDDALPLYLREAEAAWAPALAEAGLVRGPVLTLAEVTPRGETRTPLLAYRHASEPIAALLATPADGQGAGQLSLTLSTPLAAGRRLVTMDRPLPEWMVTPPHWDCATLAGVGLAALLRLHRERLGAAVARGEAAELPPFEAWPALQEKESQAHHAALEASGRFYRRSDGSLAFRFGAAVRAAYAMQRTARQQARAMRPAQPPVVNAPARDSAPVAALSSAAEEEWVLHLHRVAAHAREARVDRPVRLLVALVTSLVFLVVFGLWSSWTTAAVVLGIIVFHEAGHLLAMRACGLRNLELWLLPFFGGAAVSHESRALTPLQTVAMLLAGPWPGLLLGTLLLVGPTLIPGWPAALGFEAPAWLWSAADLLIFINVFNLLPIYPLDGGQLLDVTLVSRWPRAGLVFRALSGLALIGLGWWSRGTILPLLGVWMLLGLPAAGREAELVRRLRRLLRSEGRQDEEGLLRLAWREGRERVWLRLPAAQRIHALTRLVQREQSDTAGWAAVTLALAGWLGLVPLAALLVLAQWWMT